MNIKRMKELKLEFGLSYEMIAQETGVPLSTVQKIFSGTSKAPRYKNLLALSEFFGKLEGDQNGSSDEAWAFGETEYRYGSGHGLMKWGIPAKPQGSYTIDDYSGIPDDFRVELIEGKLFDMTAPTTVHQMIISRIELEIAEYIKSHGGKCIPYTAPLDVQLWPPLEELDPQVGAAEGDGTEEYYDGSEIDSNRLKDTVVQPDVMVLCPKGKAKLRVSRIYGPPDLVMEIVSPGSGNRDTVLKLDIYKKAGVREYWIIDPASMRILVYDFTAKSPYTIYGYRDKVPVGIYGGDLEIDFAGIDDYVKSAFRSFGNEEMI